MAAVVLIGALLAGAWMWFRTSSLVAVQRVQITGVSGPDASAIRSALTTSALGMTTLDVQLGQLHTAVSPYPVVRSLKVTTQFPHGMRIHVVEQVPVALISSSGRDFEVAADGTILRNMPATASLPTIPIGIVPGGATLTGTPLSEVQLLAAAPYRLLGKLTGTSDDSVHGLGVQLRNGPKIYFGTPDQLGAKWRAALAVLAAPSAAGADYIDVSDPTRPVAGAGNDVAGPPPAATSAAAAAAGLTTPTSTGAPSTASGTPAATGAQASTGSGTPASTGAGQTTVPSGGTTGG